MTTQSSLPALADKSYLSEDAFSLAQRHAKALSKSGLLPEAYNGNEAACFVGIHAALRLGIEPLLFLQKCYVVKGSPMLSGQLSIALINNSEKTKGNVRFTYEGKGKDRSCTATVVDADGEIITHTLRWETVEAEGWNTRAGSKWKTDPDLMFAYRSASRLARLNFPEVMLGLYTEDEVMERQTIEGTVMAPPEDRLVERMQEAEPVDAVLEQTPAPAPDTPAPKPKRDKWDIYRQLIGDAVAVEGPDGVDDLEDRFFKTLTDDIDKQDASFIADEKRDLLSAASETLFEKGHESND